MLSDYLKEHSRKDHDSIESKVDLVKLATNPNHYLKLLQAFLGFYTNIEKSFLTFEEEFSALNINIAGRLKKNLLINDIKHFGVSDEEIKNLPVSNEVPEIKNIHEAMGVLYVLEGSTMGGQIIFKQLLKAEIITPNSEGGNFFKPYGAATMPMWMSFKESLNRLSTDKNDLVLEKARETFNTMETWLIKSVR